MPHQVSPAAHIHPHGHAAGHPHDDPHNDPHDDPHTLGHEHGHGALPGSARGPVGHAAAIPSPLWWSASLRLACAALLAATLWLVIAWAVA